MRSLCVFCSSSDAVSDVHKRSAEELGAAIVHNGWSLIYGGTTVGLMGLVAASVKSHGGHVVGVIPEVIAKHGIGNAQADEMIVTRDLRERKAVMESRADAFVALPGGYGTLEEIFEIVTLRQLNAIQKPAALLNINGFYDAIGEFIRSASAGQFIKPEAVGLCPLIPDVPSLFDYLQHYKPITISHKWFRDVN